MKRKIVVFLVAAALMVCGAIAAHAACGHPVGRYEYICNYDGTHKVYMICSRPECVEPFAYAGTEECEFEDWGYAGDTHDVQYEVCTKCGFMRIHE